MSVHPRFDHSGRAFATPEARFLSKSWRLEHDFLGHGRRVAEAVKSAPTLLGQDAIDVNLLSPGLAVYAGYCYGLINNIAALRARFAAHAKIVSITPFVESSVPVMCLDIEPGNAGPSDAPGFMRIVNHDGAAKPIFYMSAGDCQLVIDALSAAGYARDEYFLWSAHWIGLHICGPSTCGFPQADATQYASNDSFDSDVWFSYVFAPPNPFPELSLTNPYTVDPVNGVNAVHSLQTRLNVWAASARPTNPKVTVDGSFGPLTEQAVKLFQSSVGITSDGVVGPVTWAHLNAVPPAPPKAAPLSAKGERAVSVVYKITIDRSIPGYKGAYATKVSGSGWEVTLPSAGEIIAVTVPKPGSYTVTTSATGWKPSSETVEVPAS